MIVTVVNHKGGVTKTTTAIHLAGFLALEDGEGSTALVDTDPNEGALEWAARGEEAETPLPFSVLGPEDRPGGEEHVVYDSQGRLYGEDLDAAAEFSDVLVVPTTVDGVAVNTLMRFVEDVEELGAGAKCRVLLTRVPHRWSLRVIRTRRALEEAGVPLFSGQIRERVAFQDAGTAGVLVGQVKGKGAREGWEDYLRIGRELIGER